MTESSEGFARSLVLWPVIVAIIIILLARRRAGGTGLVLAYLALFTEIHWLPALLYASPDYLNFYDPRPVELGYSLALYGLVGFSAGVLFVAWRRSRPPSPAYVPNDEKARLELENASLPSKYLAIGLLSYFVLFPLSGNIPSLVSITVNLRDLILVGIALLFWQAHQSGNQPAALGWLMAPSVLPVLTMATDGFMGAGLLMLIVILMFGLHVTGLRWRSMIVGVLVGFFLVSLLINYMNAREEVRRISWDTESSFEQRLSTVSILLRDFEFFDPAKLQTLVLIDKREGQNYYIGLAVNRLDKGLVDYSSGGTLLDSILFLIPRAVWPDKPLSSGGSSLVSYYAGLNFHGSTSVGMGQVMEFFVNFGLLGVVVGMAILGAALTWVDTKAAHHLVSGNWQAYAVWYMAGLGPLVGGSALFNITVSSAAGVIATLLVNRVVLPLWRKPEPPVTGRDLDNPTYGFEYYENRAE